jgi:hypothetical protein
MAFAAADVKAHYQLTSESQAHLPGVSNAMCAVAPLTGLQELLGRRPYWEQVIQRLHVVACAGVSNVPPPARHAMLHAGIATL